MKRKYILVSVICISLLLVVFHLQVMTYIGNFLVVEDPLYNADVIIILSGDHTGQRVATGVELFKRGIVDKIFMVGGLIQWHVYDYDIMKKQAVFLGVPYDKVIVIDQGESTFAQAKQMTDVMKINGFESAIVVTSNYHTRRTKYIFDKFFSSANLTVVVYPSPTERFDPSAWWKSSERAEVVFYEYTKLIWYWARYWFGSGETE